MRTLLFDHDVFGAHEVPPGHAEQQARYTAVDRALSSPEFAHLTRELAPKADRTALLRAHGERYVDDIFRLAPTEGMVQLDADTFMGPHSLDAALRGAGGAVAAIDAVFAGRADNAFVAARPPGHHTVPDQAMGFCVFNNAAIAARHARAVHGARRIAVVDFDVHHGNGTQDIFFDDEDAFFASSHEWPQYPGTGRADEKGAFEQIHNAPLATGEGSSAFRLAWGNDLLPALSEFRPDVIVISAGFDAHAADPLGGLELLEADFAWFTGQIMQIARDCCEGRVVSVLEGGYDLSALQTSVAAHVKTLASLDGPR
ncbi:histone deacetylase family protein [Parvularcula sp. LCG005]|uniref:histone deacetylase family protein n=1 Tax=Parvularcula sp. LCG005 TaxID=3078805 RepID=UPI00294321F3|nr:histone deacetylase family protein [Parvularcula sp. LCG005]WOI54639.1 histone deacetylase family protein [Parvularcula sp. LCG005]